MTKPTSAKTRRDESLFMTGHQNAENPVFTHVSGT